MIKPSEFTITYIRDLTSRELEFVHLFWRFADDEDLNRFAHTINSLNEDFSDIKIKKSQSVTKLILDLAFISCPKIICTQCNQTIKFQFRGSLEDVNKKENFLCQTCQDLNLQNELTENLGFLDYFVEKVELPDSLFDINLLNYFEKIYLLIILENSNPNGHFILDSVIVSDDADQNLIISLEEKGIIFHLHSQMEIVSNLFRHTNTIEKNIHHLDRDQRLKFALLSNKIPKLGMYLLFKENEISRESIKNQLTESLKRKNTITLDEVKGMERIIREILQNRAVTIVNFASKYYNFYSKKDEALKNVLNYATWKYSMRRVCSIIYYAAKDLASNMQARDIHSAVLQHALCKKIESYIAYLDENPNAKVYFKDIPEKVQTTKISTFTTANIFIDVLSWDCLSGREILNHWIGNYLLNSDE